MKGLLVVNSFLVNAKFGELYRYLQTAAAFEKIELEVRSSSELFLPFGQVPTADWDFVLFWDKDLLLARAFERAGYAVFNSSEAIALCDDKALTAEALADAGLPTPLTLAAPKTYVNIGYCNFEFLDRAEEMLSYPMVIKHRCGSFGAQVFLAHSREEAEKILCGCCGNEVILQQFISESSGRDLRINVVGGEVHGVMLRYNDHDFRSNITNGGQMQRYMPEKSYLEAAIAAAEAVKADFAGVDVMFGKDGPVICEVNASPHFKSTYQATGVNLAVCILKYIRKKLER